MKKLLSITLFSILLGCSGSDDNNPEFIKLTVDPIIGNWKLSTKTEQRNNQPAVSIPLNNCQLLQARNFDGLYRGVQYSYSADENSICQLVNTSNCTWSNLSNDMYKYVDTNNGEETIVTNRFSQNNTKMTTTSVDGDTTFTLTYLKQ